MILELQDWDTTFLATKIELFDKEIKIDFPKGKTITQEEVTQLARNSFEYSFLSPAEKEKFIAKINDL